MAFQDDDTYPQFLSNGNDLALAGYQYGTITGGIF